MKKIPDVKKTGLLVAMLFAFSVMNAQEPVLQKPEKTNDYCAVLKDGAIVLMRLGIVVNEPATLQDGSTITKDGTVVRKDGSKVLLKNGECIDINGNVSTPEREKKIQQPKKP